MTPLVLESISEYAYLISFLCHFSFIRSTTFTFMQLADNINRSKKARKSTPNATQAWVSDFKYHDFCFSLLYVPNEAYLLWSPGKRLGEKFQQLVR